MKFGREFRTHLEETLPEWRDKFLCYKPLKKLIKHTTIDDENAFEGKDEAAGSISLVQFEEWFVRILNEELEKFNDFYVDKEEEFVIRFQELKERIERVKENRSLDGFLTLGSKFSEEIMEIRKDFVTIHGEMVLLENYSSLNFAGLVKILKKFDKRTGGLLQLPFTQRALHQPFFTTEPLTRLVRECEANLELLFPLEEEVIESTSVSHNQGNTLLNNAKGPHLEAPSLGEGADDIYRSTLSAMRTIRGLRMSSTRNPLSYASHFRSEDEEDTGAVTAEELGSESAMVTNMKANEQDDDATSAM
ncbi:SPX domain-containing protein [Drosera capensis]